MYSIDEKYPTKYRHITKILQIEPSCYDEGDKNSIIDAKIQVKINDKLFWCWIPDWRSIFPYNPQGGPIIYGVGNELISNLIGKEIEIGFRILALNHSISNKKIKSIIGTSPKHKERNKLIGQICDIIPRDKWFDVYIDCGVFVGGIPKFIDTLSIGDFIEVEGRFDGYILAVND